MPFTQSVRDTSTAERYCAALIEHADNLRFSELFARPHSAALYFQPSRHGVGVTALRTRDLSKRQLADILTYRLAQYLAAGLVDPAMVYAERMEHDPLSAVSANDIHVLAGEPESGRLLCYMVFRAVEPSAPLVTMGEPARPRFPVEEAFGWGIYQDLPLVAELPVTQVLELSRFVKNHRLDPRHEGAVRSPSELGVALYRILCGATSPKYRAVIGDIEETGAKRNLDYFHIPTLLLRDAAPLTPEQGFLGWAAQSRQFVPFTFLVADLARQGERLAAVEAALALPGPQGIHALLRLKRTSAAPPSSLAADPSHLPHPLMLEAGFSQAVVTAG